MGLPKEVKKQADKANDILKKILADQDQPPAEPQPTPPVNTPPIVAPVEPTPPPPIEPVTAPPVVATPAPAPPEPVVPPQTTPPTCAECSKWEHKFSVLQGKYDKEVPRFTYRIAFLENQIDDLKRQLDARNAEPVPPVASAPGVAVVGSGTSIADMLKNSTDEKIKSYRENFPDVFEFVISAVDMAAQKAVTETENRLRAVEQKSLKAAQDEFIAIMNKEVPDWQEICQKDPNWIQWLSQPDRYSSRNRLDLLKEASAGFNAKAIVNMLKDFKTETGSAQPLPQPIPQTPPQQPVFVAPPSGPAQPPPATPQAEFIARSFIDQFYQDVVRGKYKGRAKEKEAIQAKIDRAISKGLILDK